MRVHQRRIQGGGLIKGKGKKRWGFLGARNVSELPSLLFAKKAQLEGGLWDEGDYDFANP